MKKSISGDVCVSWKEIAGDSYNENAELYIKSFNFDGGGAYGISKNGLYQISYIYRERKIKIFFANIVLFFIWILKLK